MPPAARETSSSTDSVAVAWNDVVRFVRQLSHDLRNHLNAAELQSAYLGEIVSDPEIKEEVKRLRQMMSELGSSLQKLTASLGHVKPTLMSYRAQDFMEDLRQKLTNDSLKDSPPIEWKLELHDANLQIDAQLLQQALLELFSNAFRHNPTGGPLQVIARIEGNSFVFTLREPKAKFELSSDKWGREPLAQVGQGHYGLGLNRVRVIVEAHGGQFRAMYDPNPSSLVTTIRLPLGVGES